jgi:hypothetical protein
VQLYSLLELLRLEDDTKDPIEKSHYSEGATNNCTHRRNELIKLLALRLHQHRHRRDVIRESSFRHITLIVLQNTVNKYYLRVININKHPLTFMIWEE